VSQTGLSRHNRIAVVGETKASNECPVGAGYRAM
jgi:hypothetical protein